jgi:hypothetical protein
VCTRRVSQKTKKERKKERKEGRKEEDVVKALSHGLYRNRTYSPLCLVQALIPVKACGLGLHLILQRNLIHEGENVLNKCTHTHTLSLSLSLSHFLFFFCHLEKEI